MDYIRPGVINHPIRVQEAGVRRVWSLTQPVTSGQVKKKKNTRRTTPSAATAQIQILIRGCNNSVCVLNEETRFRMVTD